MLSPNSSNVLMFAMNSFPDRNNWGYIQLRFVFLLKKEEKQNFLLKVLLHKTAGKN